MLYNITTLLSVHIIRQDAIMMTRVEDFVKYLTRTYHMLHKNNGIFTKELLTDAIMNFMLILL